jgi:N-acetyl sugar amidotransferase
MQYCVRCLYPANHPLGLTFDAAGVCSGCRIHEEKDELDWQARGARLGGLLDGFRNTSGSNYDCIVPVSGARDSYFIVDTVKNVYGMNPLLVSYNRHHNTERGIRNLAYLRTVFNCDFVQMVMAPQRVQRITRETIRRLGSMYWHVLAGQTVFPVQVAVRYKIPLIVWGAHQGCDQVGMFSHLDEVEMTRKYRCDHDLMGVEAEDLVGGSEALREQDLKLYMYPHDKELAKVGVRGIYLSNYLRWDSKAQHEAMIERYGYETARQQRTFDTYNDVDCQHYSGLHDHVKFVKHGYGKVTDHACREIRLRRMTRSEGADLVRRYAGIEPSDKQSCLDWVGMDADEFDASIDAHRSPLIWTRDEAGHWQLRDGVLDNPDGEGTAATALGKKEECEFAVTPSRDPSADESRYALLKRGYVDTAPARVGDRSSDGHHRRGGVGK